LVFVVDIRQGVAGVVWRGSTRAAGIFPLGLGGQTVGPTFLFRKPLTESVCLVPANKNNRLIIFLRKPTLAAELSMPGIELLVLGVCDLSYGYVKGIADVDLVFGPLVPITALFLSH